MSKNERFRNFIGRILQTSKLRIEAGSLQKAFEDEIMFNGEEVHKFVKNMEDMWESWKQLSSIDFISRFIEDLGPPLFASWLSEVFPFEFEQIRARCPDSPSTEDVLLDISYEFSQNELGIIKDNLIAHWINTSEDQVAQILFIEAIKSISDIFSVIINEPFKIYTSDVNLVRDNNNLKIHYSAAGRVVK
ncbi:MAG: hypothetical protein LUQ65_07315 [Candidatus Helarchaeota archaeon]|nr:hypothetical protein [Candidatus Helarchaeota archaeon]